MSRSRILVSTVALIVTGVVTLAAGSGPAAAQTCSPDDVYGCNSTTTTATPPSGIPTCTVSIDGALPGQRVTATVTNVPVGTKVDLLLNGTIVASGTSAAATAGATHGNVTMEFTVPSIGDGRYTLVAVGAALQAECGPDQGFEVLSATAARRPSGGGGGGGGSLARTGAGIGLMLALAIVLLIVGRAVRDAAREEERRAAAAKRRAARDRERELLGR